MNASGTLKVLRSAGEGMAVALMTVTKCVAQGGWVGGCLGGWAYAMIGCKSGLLLSSMVDTGMNACSSPGRQDT